MIFVVFSIISMIYLWTVGFLIVHCGRNGVFEIIRTEVSAKKELIWK